jgi:hypothetical protein
VVPQVLPVSAKTLFGLLTAEIDNDAVPAFESVNVCDALLPTLTLPKLTVAGVRAAWAVPVTEPVSWTVCVAGLALSVTVSVAL